MTDKQRNRALRDVGRRFGMLTVLHVQFYNDVQTGKEKCNFIVKCDCGTRIVAERTMINNIRCGSKRSCGCLVRDKSTRIGGESLTRLARIDRSVRTFTCSIDRAIAESKALLHEHGYNAHTGKWGKVTLASIARSIA